MRHGGSSARRSSGQRNIQRYEHNGFRGWVVSVKRNGRRRVEYVSDAAHGGRQPALREAIRRRDEIEAKLPPATKFHRRSRVNRTGVVGVFLTKERTRAGAVLERYGATWTELDGRHMKRSFSLAKYGARRARALAVQARRQAIAHILSQRGARVWWQR